MRSRLERGDTQLEDMLVLVGLIVIIFIFILPGRSPSLTDSATTWGGTSSGTTVSGPALSGSSGSTDTRSNLVSLRRGSASSDYRPSEEYITITNRSDSPVDITGWKLANAKDTRPYEQSGAIYYSPRDEATIPQASPFISPTGPNVLQNVVLQPGETAIVTTGSMGSRTPYTITSFKENTCSGYLDAPNRSYFTPALDKNCLNPEDEPGVEGLPIECREFIERLPACQVPDFTPRDKDNETCHNCVNRERIPGYCSDFIEERYNYGSCIATHISDPDFSGDTWRVFLSRQWEMWAEDHETIFLYDRLGNLMASLSY